MINGQIIKDMGGERVARSQGVCVVCLCTTWGFVDDVAPDPRGPFGLSTAAPLEACEYDRIGDDVPVCYGCRQVNKTYFQALDIAKSKWTVRLMTRNDYMSGKVSHADYYSAIAKELHLSFDNSDMLPRIKQCLETDEHLNNIPLRTWDNLAVSYIDQRHARQVFKNFGDGYSLAGMVCALKQAAKNSATKAAKRRIP